MRAVTSVATGTGRLPGTILVMAVIVAACGGSTPATPTAAPPTPPPTTAPQTTEPAASPTSAATGPASIEAVDTIEAGKRFEVAWTGPNANRDYITIVKLGATKWTNEPYFYTTLASPQSLTAPSTPGSYELWYVNGDDETIATRRPIEITAFQGALQGPGEVMGGTEFEVSWQGPDGPGDYVTIVKAGATQWTNESYFYTGTGNPGRLVAALEPGAYELWYVIGADETVQARLPITVTAPVATLDGPAEVARNADFEVAWTGPNGPSDYVTIVPAGSASGAYLSYAYTNAGSPAKLKAPEAAGAYELWYVSGRGNTTLVTAKITVR